MMDSLARALRFLLVLAFQFAFCPFTLAVLLLAAISCAAWPSLFRTRWKWVTRVFKRNPSFDFSSHREGHFFIFNVLIRHHPCEMNGKNPPSRRPLSFFSKSSGYLRSTFDRIWNDSNLGLRSITLEIFPPRRKCCCLVFSLPTRVDDDDQKAERYRMSACSTTWIISTPIWPRFLEKIVALGCYANRPSSMGSWCG